MQQIDYGLVAMTDADHQRVREEVLRRVDKGLLGEVERGLSGRLVVVNPDPVQTVHQVPDELRPRLRRILLPTQIGSRVLSGAQLFEQMVDSDERLYLVLIELQEEFKALPELLDQIPRLRELYPEMVIYLCGSASNLLIKLRQLLNAGGTTVRLHAPDRGDPIEVGTQEVLDNTVSEQDQVVEFQAPFLSQLRIVLDPKAGPVTSSLEKLARLHPVFGHGPIQQVAGLGGRKEPMAVVNLPLLLVRELRFRQDRGLDFHGIERDGEVVLSRFFGDERLEFHWVPLESITAFLRRNPAGAPERIVLAEVSHLRINCRTGQTSFVMRDSGEQVKLDTLERISFRRKHGAASLSRSGAAKSGPQASTDTVVSVDGILRPRTVQTAADPVQQAVKGHFYGTLIGEAVEKDYKLGLYARRLRVASVGPLAAQTLKMLRRFGLEQFIEPDSFHYLCDEPAELADYAQTPSKYEQHFGELLDALRKLAGSASSGSLRVDDITFNLPLSTEWVDTGLATFDKVGTEQLDAVYKEMGVLLAFIQGEFQRTFDIQDEDSAFFAGIKACRSAALLAKWLAEFKRGSYGKLLQPGEQPDVVVFATGEDKRDNDTRLFFPGFACTDLFSNPDNRKLFEEIDYDFCVFLEEQLALAIHVLREDGEFEPKADHFKAYFQARIAQTREDIAGLQRDMAAIDDTGSEIYQRMMREEEQHHHEREQSFIADLQRVESQQAESAKALATLVTEAGSLLDDSQVSNSQVDTEQSLLGAAERTQSDLLKALLDAYAAVTDHIGVWREALLEFASTLNEVHKFHHAWQTIVAQRAVGAAHQRWHERLPGRREALRRMNAQERDAHAKRIEAQRLNVTGDRARVQEQLAAHGKANQRAHAALHTYLERTGPRLEALRAADPANNPLRGVAQADALSKHMEQVSRNAAQLAARADASLKALEQLRHNLHRYDEQLHQLEKERELLVAVIAGRQPPAPQVPSTPSQEDETKRHTDIRRRKGVLAAHYHALSGMAVATGARLGDLKGAAGQIERFAKTRERLIKLVARAKRLRASAQSLTERQQLMEQDLAGLAEQVRERFMPARKRLLKEVFIPEAERRAVNLSRTAAFVTELYSLSREQLAQTYLDHAVFRRYYAAQFVSGAVFAHDMNSAQAQATRNIQPALRVLARSIRHTFTANGRSEAAEVNITERPHETVQGLTNFLERQAEAGPGERYGYAVLPHTLPLADALALMKRKEQLFKGIPQLVLVLVTKFPAQRLRDEPGLRDDYFNALRHNVIINVDGHAVIDNPHSIAGRMLEETLGCAIDLDTVEEVPEGAKVAD